MNGPRTNQFVAPTSFITSISRRREKIESRMVFAISSTEAPSSTSTAIRKTSSITRATLRIRLESFCPSLTVSTPTNFCVRMSAEIAFSESAFAGVTSKEAGNGFDGEVLGELRIAPSCAYLSASARET